MILSILPQILNFFVITKKKIGVFFVFSFRKIKVDSLHGAKKMAPVGASEDNTLTYTSDGRQPKPQTVLEHHRSKRKSWHLATVTADEYNLTKKTQKQVHRHDHRLSLANLHPTGKKTPQKKNGR